MNLFDVKRIKWYKYMDNTIENVNLSAVTMLDGSTKKFDFSNSVNEKHCGSLVCKNIIKYNVEYDSVADIKMPYFILDVRVKKLSKEEIEDALRYYRYSFDGHIKSIKDEEHYLINIIGNEICIDILCRAYELHNE